MNTSTTKRRDFKSLKQRRMKAAKLFEEGCSQAEVARQLGVSRETSRRWHEAWEQNGRQGLKGAGRAGRKPKLQPEEVKVFTQALKRGPEAHGYSTSLWTLERMADVLKTVVHVDYHPRHMWRVLRQMGWSCQRPQTRARECNDKTVKNWVRSEWPRIKKKPAD